MQAVYNQLGLEEPSLELSLEDKLVCTGPPDKMLSILRLQWRSIRKAILHNRRRKPPTNNLPLLRIYNDIQATQVLRNPVRLSCPQDSKKVLTLRQDPSKSELRRSNTLRLSNLPNLIHNGQVRLKMVVTEPRHSTVQITRFGEIFLRP